MIRPVRGTCVAAVAAGLVLAATTTLIAPDLAEPVPAVELTCRLDLGYRHVDELSAVLVHVPAGDPSVDPLLSTWWPGKEAKPISEAHQVAVGSLTMRSPTGDESFPLIVSDRGDSLSKPMLATLRRGGVPVTIRIDRWRAGMPLYWIDPSVLPMRVVEGNCR